MQFDLVLLTLPRNVASWFRYRDVAILCVPDPSSLATLTNDFMPLAILQPLEIGLFCLWSADGYCLCEFSCSFDVFSITTNNLHLAIWTFCVAVVSDFHSVVMFLFLFYLELSLY